MKILNIQQNSDEWLVIREERITGTKVGKLFEKSRKKDEWYNTEKPTLQLYQVAAERLTVGSQDAIDQESAMDRGHTLEPEAISLAVKKLGIGEAVHGNVWQDTENQNFLCSPDAYENKPEPTWAIEVKCLSSARHLKAIVENEYPSEYLPQILNYFLICKTLKTLYFVMYDPRFVNEKNQLKIFEVKRKDVEQQLKELKEIRQQAESTINQIVNKLMF